MNDRQLLSLSEILNDPDPAVRALWVEQWWNAQEQVDPQTVGEAMVDMLIDWLAKEVLTPSMTDEKWSRLNDVTDMLTQDSRLFGLWTELVKEATLWEYRAEKKGQGDHGYAVKQLLKKWSLRLPEDVKESWKQQLIMAVFCNNRLEYQQENKEWLMVYADEAMPKTKKNHSESSATKVIHAVGVTMYVYGLISDDDGDEARKREDLSIDKALDVLRSWKGESNPIMWMMTDLRCNVLGVEKLTEDERKSWMRSFSHWLNNETEIKDDHVVHYKGQRRTLGEMLTMYEEGCRADYERWLLEDELAVQKGSCREPTSKTVKKM